MKDLVAYLGHVINKAGVSVDASKVADIIACPLPQNIKALEGFLGLSRCYKKFVKGYSFITKPLTVLLQRIIMYGQKRLPGAFEELKEAIISAPVLKLQAARLLEEDFYIRDICLQNWSCSHTRRPSFGIF